MTDTAPVSDLSGWTHKPFTAAGITHDCFEKGEGPGVVVMPEIPGIHPEVLGFADHLVDQGFTVVLGIASFVLAVPAFLVARISSRLQRTEEAAAAPAAAAATPATTTTTEGVSA